MRSSWKLKTTELSTLRDSFMKSLTSNNSVKTWAKGISIFLDLSEKNLQIYNGAKFIDLPIKKEMIGSVVGNFVLTKRITGDIHNKTKRNKKGRMKKKSK